jgi:hypothetical protein
MQNPKQGVGRQAETRYRAGASKRLPWPPMFHSCRNELARRDLHLAARRPPVHCYFAVGGRYLMNHFVASDWELTSAAPPGLKA